MLISLESKIKIIDQTAGQSPHRKRLLWHCLNLTCWRLKLGTKIPWTTIMTSAKVLISKYNFYQVILLKANPDLMLKKLLSFDGCSSFQVHLAYARAATKQQGMCGTRKIFHAAGFMCDRHTRMYTDTAILFVVTLKWRTAIKTCK